MQEELPVEDHRRLWLERYFLTSFRPHRRASDSREWLPKADIEVHKICAFYHEACSTAYRHELSQLRRSRAGDRSDVPELDNAIRVRTELGGARLNEALLFHCYDWGNVRDIVGEAFDSRLDGLGTGAAFGIGGYFTTVASKADFYTKCEDGCHFMLVAHVALGEVHVASLFGASLCQPPLGQDGVRCDFCHGQTPSAWRLRRPR